MNIWTVYKNPTDYPNKFVARRFNRDQPTCDIIIGATLKSIHQRLPAGLVRLHRDPIDHPNIVESWI